MAITIADVITNFNSFIGDPSTDRISAAERLQYATEATIWLQDQLQNDTQLKTYTLLYFDTVHYYKTTQSITALLDGADLRRSVEDQYYSFARKSPRELAEDIGQQSEEDSWAIQRNDGDSYLVVNHNSKYQSQLIADFDSLTSSGGTWAVDAVNSDATNLTVDTNEYKQGSASLNFDITVSQSGNNRATISNSSVTSTDLSSVNDLASFIMWVYIPNVTFTSSLTLFWGSSSSNYWSATVTTDVNGNAFAAGWNRIRWDWQNATATGTPNAAAITYIRFDVNYSGSQTNDTDYRVDDLIVVRPEKLTFFYNSRYVGTNTGGTPILVFTATTDIPYFSSQDDNYKFSVAHKAASICFLNLRLRTESQDELTEATRCMMQLKTIIPASKTPATKNFKLRGVNLTRYHRH